MVGAGGVGGVGGVVPTTTRVVRVIVVPSVPTQERVYRVVLVGDTVTEPFVAPPVLKPVPVHPAVRRDAQVSVADPPGCMVPGLLVMPAIGAVAGSVSFASRALVQPGSLG
jgi:hypothetical protein